MLKRLWLVALVLITVSRVQAVELKEGHPEQYVVKDGDTLWDISETFLRDPWLWPEIWQLNSQIENPHLIYPGDTIGLVYTDQNSRMNTKTRLTVTDRGPGGNTVKLTPTARITMLDTAIPAIPLDAIASFLTNSRIVKAAQLEGAPYVVAGDDNRILAGGGGTVYARGFERGEEPESAYGLFRKGQLFVDPDTSEVLGLEAREIGTGTVATWDGDIAKLELSSAREEVVIGDRLLATDERKLVTNFMPSSPSGTVQGRMIAVLSGVNQIGQFNVVVVNQGEREGVTEGNVLAIYKEGGVVLDRVTRRKVRLPAERAGLLMLFRVFDKVSYGLVLKAKRPLSVGDQVRNP